MKKISVLLLILVVSSGIVFAGIDGFKGNLIKKTSVAEALKMNDDTYVTVQGNIVKKLSDDMYLFKDATGSMNVEIDKDKWKGVSADTKDLLELTGEVEKKYNSTKLDVDMVRKINN